MGSVFKRLELRHLRLVQALAKADGMSAAAKYLHLTQSALSHQLKVLEDTLDSELFLRHGKKLVITAEGRRVLEASESILTELENMKEDLVKMKQGGSITLRIATECITTFQWLPRVIPKFKSHYPGIQVELIPKASSQVTQLLETGEIDIAIKMVPAKKPFQNHILFSDQLVVVMEKKHRLAKKEVITPEDIALENLLLCPNAKQKLFLGLSQHVDTDAIQTTEFPLTEAIVEWCHAGMGVSVLADWSVDSWPKKGMCVRPFNVPWGRRSWSAVTLPQVLPEYMKRFIGLLQESAPS